MADQTPDEKYIVEFFAQTDQAIEDIAEFQSLVAEMKTRIGQMAAETGASFDAIGFALRKQIKELIEDDEQLSKFSAAISAAFKEIKESATIYAKGEKKAAIADVELEKRAAKEIADAYKVALEGVKQKENEIKQVILNNAQVAKDQAKETAEIRKQKVDEVLRKEREIAQQVANQKYMDQVNKADKATSGFSKTIGNLGTVAKFVFGGIFGLTVLGILRQFITLITGAAESGYEFVKAMYQLSVGVRVLQRSGMDITIAQIYENLDILRDKFKVFTTKELVVGSAAFTNLVRDLGFTRDQFFRLQDAIATLAVVNGRAMDEVQRTVALALSSGYTEGLQRLGVSINRVNIAQEAMRLGFEGGYTALSEQQRSLATYNLIIEKTAKYQEDLAGYYTTLPGQIDSANKSIEEQKNQLGTLFVPFQAKFAQAKLQLLIGVTDFIKSFLIIKETVDNITKGIGVLIEKALKPFAATIERLEVIKRIIPYVKLLGDIVMNITNPFAILPKAIGLLSDQILKGADAFVKFVNVSDKVPDSLKEIANSIQAILEGRFADILEGVSLEDTDVATMDAMLDKIETAIEDHMDEISKIEEDEAEERRKIQVDLQRDLEQMEREGARRRQEAIINAHERIGKVIRDSQYEIEDAMLRFNLDVQQVWDDYYADREKQERDHRDRVLEIEKDYQEQLRRLREDFLFDLEDVLRDRDARAVLKLVRQYNLDKARLDRERLAGLGQAQVEYEQRLADLESQRERRLKQLKQDFDLRIELIRRQRNREIREEMIKLKQELEEQKRGLDAQRFERIIRYQQQQQDLETALDQRLQKIAEALAEELRLTGDNANLVYQTLVAVYGPGGKIEKIYQYYLQMVGKYSAMISAFAKSWAKSGDWGKTPKSAPKSTTPPTPQSVVPGSGTTTGTLNTSEGVVIPSSAANRLPIASLPRSRVVAPSPVAPSLANQRVSIELLLSPDLQARIVDQSLSIVADVVFKEMR